MNFGDLKEYVKNLRIFFILVILGLILATTGLFCLRIFHICEIHWIWIMSPLWISGAIGLFFAVLQYLN